MTHSTYSHKTRVQGTSYDVDCSGFVDVLLARVDPPGLEEVRAATVRRPLARHFVQFFRAPSGARWHAVGRVANLGPGNLLAWTKPADVTSSNTGHVMVVAGPPRASGGAWVVPVIDSSASPHGRGDSRKAAHATGIGKGTVVLDVNPAGRPVGYRWSEWKKSRAHPTEIAMGRLR